MPILWFEGVKTGNWQTGTKPGQASPRLSFLLLSSPVLPGSVSRYTWPSSEQLFPRSSPSRSTPEAPRRWGRGVWEELCIGKKRSRKGAPRKAGPCSARAASSAGSNTSGGGARRPTSWALLRAPEAAVQGPGFGAAPAEPRACGWPALGSPRPPPRARRTYSRTRPRSRRSRARWCLAPGRVAAPWPGPRMTVRVSTQQTATPGASGAVPRHSFQKERRGTPSRPLRRRGARLAPRPLPSCPLRRREEPLDPACRALCAGVKCL